MSFPFKFALAGADSPDQLPRHDPPELSKLAAECLRSAIENYHGCLRRLHEVHKFGEAEVPDDSHFATIYHDFYEAESRLRRTLWARHHDPTDCQPNPTTLVCRPCGAIVDAVAYLLVAVNTEVGPSEPLEQQIGREAESRGDAMQLAIVPMGMIHILD